MKHYLLLAAIFGWLITPIITVSAHAADAYPETVEKHDEAEDHAHADGDEHNEHGEETDNHEDHGHDAHQEQDDHDGHGHGSTKPEEGHEEGEDEHGEHEEGKAEIAPESVQRMGIVINTAAPAMVSQTIPLTGRITLNQNTRADVRARFEGSVRSVNVNLGERVEKGQVLAVVESNESLQDYNIKAPISGVVLERNTNIGDVANGDVLFVIADLSNVWAKFHVFPRDADYVESGQRVSIHTLEGDKTAVGKIDMLFPTADELTQTQIAIIVLPNPERIWKPGMTIEGDVRVAETEAQIAVKASALQKMEDLGDVVFVKEGNSYIPRPVKIGRKNDGYVEIIQGLKVGEAYVSDGSFIVKSDILKATAAHSH
jgi:cobalt-zinc-cadmium efflux system membrane fusion protein